LADEWDVELNGDLTPADVSAGSHRAVWWRCSRGHSYSARVFSRGLGTGCPCCAGKRPIPGETDLAATHPLLLAEWDAQRNGRLTPSDLTAGSHRKVWWRCEQGHNWQAAPYSRAAGAGCPYCTNRRVLPGFNDLETTHPALCKEWDARLNGPLSPRALTFGSTKKVWWRCSFGHVWQAAVFSRTRNKASGCPVCMGTVKLRRPEYRPEPAVRAEQRV